MAYTRKVLPNPHIWSKSVTPEPFAPELTHEEFI